MESAHDLQINLHTHASSAERDVTYIVLGGYEFGDATTRLPVGIFLSYINLDKAGMGTIDDITSQLVVDGKDFESSLFRGDNCPSGISKCIYDAGKKLALYHYTYHNDEHAIIENSPILRMYNSTVILGEKDTRYLDRKDISLWIEKGLSQEEFVLFGSLFYRILRILDRIQVADKLGIVIPESQS